MEYFCDCRGPIRHAFCYIYCIGLQLRLNLYLSECLDDIALANVIIAADRETALEVGADLLDVVLEALE